MLNNVIQTLQKTNILVMDLNNFENQALLDGLT